MWILQNFTVTAFSQNFRFKSTFSLIHSTESVKKYYKNAVISSKISVKSTLAFSKNVDLTENQHFFRQINGFTNEVTTVWKSILKRYHAEKFSVKPQTKSLQNLILQMHDFLSLGAFLDYFQRMNFLI